MIDLTDRVQLATYLKDQHLWLKREASQHFLTDRETLDAIVRAAQLQPADVVVEIGPGLGTLTESLAEEVTEGLILAIEADVHLVKLLRENFKPFHQVKVIHHDFLRFDLTSIEADLNGYKVVSNLPYHITGAALRMLVDPVLETQQPKEMVLMVQKEVGERILAAPGTRSRGLPTILAELYGRVEKVVEVPRGAFFPPPEVDSMVIHCVRRKQPLRAEKAQAIIHLAKAGFAAKRRTLANALSGSLHQPKERIQGWLTATSIPLLARAEDLEFFAWQALADKIATDLAKVAI